MNRIYYRIAQLDIKLELYNLNPINLFNFSPFRINDEEVSELLFSISTGIINNISYHPTRHYRIDQFIIYIYILKNECFLKIHSDLTGKDYLFKANNQWADIKTNLLFNEKEEYIVFNHALMFFFIYSSSFHNTLLIHASSVRIGNDGVASLGDSGVGKSTHSQLWLDYIEGATLLNDDQPAIRIYNNKIYIYGTPWSGKKHCYKNESAVLLALFMMEQADENQITLLSPFTAFRKLLISCSMMQEERETFNSIIKTIVYVAEKIPVYTLKNKPESEAAFLAYSFCTQAIAY